MSARVLPRRVESIFLKRMGVPGTGGMAAALPHCDALVSGHSLEAMYEVAEAIAADDSSRDAFRAAAGQGAEHPDASWPSAEPTEAQRPVPMPSGYGPRRGRTTH